MKMSVTRKKAMAWMAGILVVLACLGYTAITWAGPPQGVTATLIGRATYGRFKVKTHPPESEGEANDGPISLDFMAQAKPGMDMVVRTFDYAPASTTGWHTHPGPVFINVISGTVTFYEVDDPTCTPKVVTAGQGYVDTGHGHIGRNESGLPAKDVTISIVAVGETQLRTNIQGKYCFLDE
jgi:cupin domain